jgi:pimeloyl-ACP methyl ester carboxylesterase
MSVPPTLQLAPEVRRTSVRVDGAHLAALVGTPPAAERGAALLVPGYTGSKEDFLPVLGPLARAGFRVTALDLPGQYESPGPDDPAAYSLDALGAVVAAALVEAGPHTHLVGHSFGGLVVRRAVLTGARPATLTLLGSGPAALTGRRAEVTELMRPLLEAGDLTTIADASAEMDAQDPRTAALPGDVHDFLRRRWLASSAPGLLGMGHALLSAPDEVDALRALGLPTLVAHGADDDAWDPQVQRAMAARLGAQYEVIAGAAHSPACEAPDATAAVLTRFWSAAG